MIRPLIIRSLEKTKQKILGNKGIVDGKSEGKGLALLKEFVSLNGSEIHIYSGREIWKYKNSKEESNTIYSYFPRTIVTIKIRMDDNKLREY